MDGYVARDWFCALLGMSWLLVQSHGVMVPLMAHGVVRNNVSEEREF